MNPLDAHVFDSEIGHFVSEKHRVVAQVINEYDPTLQLVWIPPQNRSFDDGQPFAIVHTPGNQPAYVVRKLPESDVNEHLIAWLWSNDQARNGRDLHGYLKALDDAKEAMKLKKQQEELDSGKDLAVSILKGKNFYRHGGRVFS